MSRSGEKTVDLMGIEFDPVTETEAVEHVSRAAAQGRGGRLVTPNLDILRQCRKDREVHAMVRQADLVVADGMPLIWASRLLGEALPERVCGSNLIFSLSARAADLGLRVFLLGGAEDTAERTKRILTERHPRLQVVGAYGPPYGFEQDPEEMARIERMVRDTEPHIVFMGLPFPKADRVVLRLQPGAPQAWWCGVGVSFSFVCGHVRRAPSWMQKTGLEWTHRWIQEPERLTRRYFVHGLPFALELLAWVPVARMRRRSQS